jgi:hypothetical protein
MLKQAVNIAKDAECDEKSFLEHMNETHQYFCIWVCKAGVCLLSDCTT